MFSDKMFSFEGNSTSHSSTDYSEQFLRTNAFEMFYIEIHVQFIEKLQNTVGDQVAVWFILSY